MATVAEQLRRAREEQKLNVYQVAEITKIKTDHIRALEAGDFDLFSAPVYIRGFIRTYESRLLADLEAELGQSEKFREPPPLTVSPSGTLDFLMLQLSKLNWRIVLATAAVALVIILSVTALRSRSKEGADPLRDLGPGLYQPTQSQSGELLPLPPSP
jgi:cytoskeletal protein RodZ